MGNSCAIYAQEVDVIELEGYKTIVEGLQRPGISVEVGVAFTLMAAEKPGAFQATLQEAQFGQAIK